MKAIPGYTALAPHRVFGHSGDRLPNGPQGIAVVNPKYQFQKNKDRSRRYQETGETNSKENPIGALNTSLQSCRP